MASTDTDAVLKEYSKLAPHYDRRWSFYIEATLRETLRRLELQPGESLLDVGCGTGVLLEVLSASVPDAKLSGADPSREMLDVARKRLGAAVVLKQSHAESLPFPDQVFDVVVSTNASLSSGLPTAARIFAGRSIQTREGMRSASIGTAAEGRAGRSAPCVEPK
ncbi:MAG: class I SAM-dependent methyltransferase [Candidatus Binatia bacterium]